MLELTCQRSKAFQDMYKELDELQAQMSTPSVSPSDLCQLKGRVHGLYNLLFAATASAKAPGVVTRLRQLLEGKDSATRKFLVFAYHRDMLNAVQAYLYRSRVEHIRVDGTTPQESRSSLIEDFQVNSHIRVAILSIKVAAVGLTLTAANCILFAELDWVPSNLLQAEDRAHRIGRKDALHIEYAVARGTLDDRLWPVLQRKLGIVSTTVDGMACRQFLFDPNVVSAKLPTSGVAVQATLLAAQNSSVFSHDESSDLALSED
jgi:SNF2 family DNA or RNA helicase